MSTVATLPLLAARLTLALTILVFLALPRAHATTAPEVDEDASFTPALGRTSPHALPPRATGGYTRTLTPQGHYQVSARFNSFDGEALQLAFLLSPAASRASTREFGIASEELDALMSQCRRQATCNQAVFDRATTGYYEAHALRLTQRKGRAAHLQVDVAKVVQRNRERVRPVAAALRQMAAERGAGTDWMVEAAIALVQSGLAYRQPATWDNGRKILGFYPPPRALEQGYGDCDTKSALLAAILQNLTRTQLVGVHVPQHYLLGVAQTPRADQAFITYGGRPYVLIEAAGPAQRRPGDVADKTLAALSHGRGVRIDPMF